MTDAMVRRLMGFVCLAIAVIIGLAAFMDPKVISSQRWAMLLCVVVFAAVGVQLVAALTGRVSKFLAGLVCLSFSCLGFFVALSGDRLSGGIPYIPDEWNQMLGRLVFGFGALLPGGLSIYFFSLAIGKKRVGDHVSD